MEQLGQDDPKSMQRLLWATLLMALIFGGWALFMQPKKAPLPEKGKEAGSAQGSPARGAAPVGGESGAPPPPSLAPVPETTAVVSGESESPVVLENNDLQVVVSNKGAVLTHVILKNYHEKGGGPDDLVSPIAALTGSYPLALVTGDAGFDKAASAALFHVEQVAEPAGEHRVTLVWSDGKGDAVTKTFGLPARGYDLSFEVSARKGGQPLSPVPVAWGPGFGRLLQVQAKNRYYQQEYVGLLEGTAYRRILRARVKPDAPPVTTQVGDQGPITWAAITNNYFAAVFMPQSPLPWVKVTTVALTAEEQKVHPAESDIGMVVGYPGKGRLFLGPKEYGRLKAMGGGLHRLLDWGTSAFGNAILEPICALLLWSLKKLFLVSHNYGVAILLLTLVIKVAFYPLTQSSMVKMKEMGEAMKKLKPQIDRIKSKYKKMPKDMATRSKMNEEMMALYQREGINPLGGMSGCLPMLLQLPFFFALFTLLPRAIDLRGAAFVGWIHDLSVPDPYYITPLLMGGSMVFSTKMTATQGMEGPQKMLLWFMPIMFTWFCLWAPAGLTLYWLANNVLTMGQQAIINRQVARRMEDAARGRKSTPKGQSKPSH